MRNIISGICAILICFNSISFAQSTDIYLFIDSNTIIGKISDNKLFTGPSEVAYTLSGNTVYVGDSTSKEQILFLVNAKDMLHRKSGVILQADGRTVQYIAMQNSFYLGDHPIDKDNEELLHFEVINDSLTEVYSGISDLLIGVIEGKLTSQSQVTAAAHQYIRHFSLDDSVRARMAQFSVDIVTDGKSFIHPKLDMGPYYEWVWDGQTLKPLWGYRPEDEWVFDGKYLKPAWSADPQTEWVWDGKVLKPFWESGVDKQWLWDDAMLKPFWDSNPDLQWTFDEGVWRPMWRFNDAEEWVVEGYVPVPVAALVVLGMADR